MTTSRRIKEELLDIYAPEPYVHTSSSRKRKLAVEPVKAELKLESVSEEAKPRVKARSRRKRNVADDVELVGVSAPRRRYRWKGRRVQKVLRPGSVVVFSPGERSATRAPKRSSDEMFADADVLEQFERGEGEFAYGKRQRRMDAVVLDASNPTPSMQPITPQIPLQTRGIKREGDAVPTLEVLAPKKRKAGEREDLFAVTPGSAAVLPSRAVSTSVKRARQVKMEVDEEKKPVTIEDIKVRDVKRVAPGLGVQTIDFKVPVESPRKMEIDDFVSKTADGKVIYPKYRLHPSMEGFPRYVRTRRPRKKRAAEAKTRGRRRLVLPGVSYHPSISLPRRNQTFVWR